MENAIARACKEANHRLRDALRADPALEAKLERDPGAVLASRLQDELGAEYEVTHAGPGEQAPEEADDVVGFADPLPYPDVGGSGSTKPVSGSGVSSGSTGSGAGTSPATIFISHLSGQATLRVPTPSIHFEYGGIGISGQSFYGTYGI